MATWQIDPFHTNVEFTVRHMMVSTVRGKFEKVTGTIGFDPADPSAAAVEAVIETASINTGVTDRDNHLRSADFFEVENFPTLTFKSKRVEPSGDNEAKIVGDLTIRGITREVALNVEFLGTMGSPFGDTRAGFVASGSINREDFGLTWNQALEAGGVLVSKDVRMELNVQAVLQTETAPAS
jgi:polyisoprenoid-binding protein YceI